MSGALESCLTCGQPYKPMRKGLCRSCYDHARHIRLRKHRAEQARAWQQRNPERVIAHNRAYAKKRTALGFWKALDTKRKADPTEQHKRKIRDRIHGLVTRHWLARQPGKYFHHPDYQRPLYGCWVTGSEHRLIHLGYLPCPPCVDFEAYVKARQRFGRAHTAVNRLSRSQVVADEALKLEGLVSWP